MQHRRCHVAAVAQARHEPAIWVHCLAAINTAAAALRPAIVEIHILAAWRERVTIDTMDLAAAAEVQMVVKGLLSLVAVKTAHAQRVKIKK